MMSYENIDSLLEETKEHIASRGYTTQELKEKLEQIIFGELEFVSIDDK